MLNFLQISLTNRCNFACAYCPVVKWRNKDFPKWPLNNAELIPFIKKNTNSFEWVVELTGGEPTLYEGLDELLYWLSTHGYYTLIKSNGSNPVKRYDNVKLCSAFHRIEQPPANFDEVLIINTDGRAEKEAYCKAKGIPYHVIGFNRDNFDKSGHRFSYCSFITPDGHNVKCQAAKTLHLLTDDGSDDLGRINHREFQLGTCCPDCKAAIDAWKFLPEEIRQRRFARKLF